MRAMLFEEFNEALQDRFERVKYWNGIIGNWKESTVPLQVGLVKEELLEYVSAIGKKDIIKELIDCLVVQGYLVDLYTAFGESRDQTSFTPVLGFTVERAFLLQRIGVDILKAFDKVIESNYSKFDNYQENMLDKYDEHCKYLEKDGRYSNVKWERVVDHVVYRSGEGKLLKGRNYQEPDLSFLEAA
jgi:hypothetical protein